MNKTTKDDWIQCPECEGQGKLENWITVTRSMARDAGDMQMEGRPWFWGYDECEYCDGSGMVPPNHEELFANA